ncbi:MAG: hypothetical protein DRR42_13590 [Gammaproteobacteria bacterium]|nr:MAG: hypothetical protein DRR42_13590 [Gammaproteobacteria bacterium]
MSARKLSGLLLPLFVVLLPMGNAVAGLCPPVDLMLDTAPTVFDTVGQCGSTGKQGVSVAAYDEYSFSVADESGITGLVVSGEQEGFIVTVQVLELVDGGFADLQAELTIGAGAISGFFEAIAGRSYVLHVVGKGFGTYNIALTAVPLPAAVWLFSGGLLSLVVVGRKRNVRGPMRVAVSA